MEPDNPYLQNLENLRKAQKIQEIVKAQSRKLKSISISSTDKFENQLKIFSNVKSFNVAAPKQLMQSLNYLSKVQQEKKLERIEDESPAEIQMLLLKAKKLLVGKNNKKTQKLVNSEIMLTGVELENENDDFGKGKTIQNKLSEYLQNKLEWQRKETAENLDEIIQAWQNQKNNSAKKQNMVQEKELQKENEERNKLKEIENYLMVQDNQQEQFEQIKANQAIDKRIDRLIDKNRALVHQKRDEEMTKKELLSGKYYEEFLKRAEKVRKVQQKKNIFVYNTMVNQLSNKEFKRNQQYHFTQLKDKINKAKQQISKNSENVYKSFLKKELSVYEKTEFPQIISKGSSFKFNSKNESSFAKKKKEVDVSQFNIQVNNKKQIGTKEWAGKNLNKLLAQICGEKIEIVHFSEEVGKIKRREDRLLSQIIYNNS